MRPTPALPRPCQGGFTLIELLIVVAIIAILAAIAVPNFLEAQTRAKVARVRADLRTLATGLEAYRVDQNEYPEGSDNANNIDPRINDLLQNSPAGDLRGAFYAQRTRNGATGVAGRDFHTLTTPVAYVTEFFTDPFIAQAAGFLTYCYRPAKDRANGYILTSFGPDADLFDVSGGGPGKGTLNPNPLGTFSDTGNPSRLGDINERAVVHALEGTDPALPALLVPYGNLNVALDDLSYDPTNGTVSDGDIYRVGP
jgi:prepilin-type N-terminal cleavage/methylation domain-containing protein